MRISRLMLATCSLTALALQLGPALAADAASSTADDTLMETVVVTAQKRVERFQDVAAAASVVDTKQIEAQQITDIGKLASSIPTFEAHPGNGGYLTVRGIGTKSWARSAQGDVVTIMDGVPLNNGANPGTVSSLFDVERVELLEGPQGTLFGGAAIAGAINIVTTTPRMGEYQFKLHADGDNRSGAVVQAAVNLPIGDDAALRVTGHRDWAPNVVYNQYRGKWDTGTTTGTRARLLWQPNESFTLNLIADFTKDHHNNEGLTVISATPDYPVGAFYPPVDPLHYPQLTQAYYDLSHALTACGVTPSKNNYKFCMDGQGYYGYQDYGVALSLDYRLSDGTILTSVTSNRTNWYFTQFDFDNTQYNLANIDGGNDIRNTFSQEFRITSPSGVALEYVAGVYFLTSQNHSTLTQAGNFNYDYWAGSSWQLLPANYYGEFEDEHNSSNTYAAFFQGTYHLSDSFSLIGGIRYTYDTLQAHTIRTLPSISVAGGAYDVSGTPYGGKVSHGDLSGKVGVQYYFDPSWMVYLTASKGYKAAAINEPTATNAPVVVKPETMYDYELGTKLGLLNQRMWLSATVYYMDMLDWQVGTYDQTSRRFYFSNAKALSVRGVDVSIFGNVSEDLFLSAAINYNLGKFSPGTWLACNGAGSYVDPNCVTIPGGTATGVNVGGYTFAGSPKWKVVEFAEYHHSLGVGDLEGFVQFDATWTDTIKYQVVFDPGSTASAAWRLGARLGVRSEDGHWGVSVFGRNLLDQRIPTNIWATTIGASLNSSTSHSSALGYDSFRRIGISLDLNY